MSTHRKAGEPKTKIEVWLQDFQELRQVARDAMGPITAYEMGSSVPYLKSLLKKFDDLYGELPTPPV